MGKFIYKELIDQLNEFIDLNSKAKKDIDNFIKASQKKVKLIDSSNSEDLKKLTIEVERLKKALEDKKKINEDSKKIEEQIIKVQEVEIKATRKIIQLTDDQLKQQIIDREQKAQKIKQLKVLIATEQGEAKTLNEVRKTIIALQIARDGLDYKENAKEVQELNIQIDQLNAVLKNNVDETSKAKLNVGNYTESIKDAISGNEAFGSTFGQLNTVLGGLNSVLSKVRNDVKETRESFNNADNSVKKFSAGAKLAGNVLKATGIALVVSAISSIGTSFADTETGAKTAALAQARLLNSFKFIGSYLVDFLSPSIGKLVNEFKIFGLEIKKTFQFGKEASETAKNISEIEKEQAKYNDQLKEFKNRSFSEEFSKIDDATIKLLDSQFKLKKETQKYNILIANRKNIESQLLAIADDDTRGFNERQEAIKKYNDQVEKQNTSLDLQVEISRKKRDILISELELTKQTNALGEGSLTVIEALNQAEIEYITAKGEREQFLIEKGQINRKVLFDQIEQQGYFLIDGNEQIKLSNEKLINSDKVNLETRRKILIETQDLINNSNIYFADAFAKSVDGLKGDDIRNAFKEAGNDVGLLKTKLDALGLAEIPINRLLGLFKEMQAQSRDFADSLLVLDEASKQLAIIGQDIEAQNILLKDSTIDTSEELDEALKVLENKRFENKVENLRKEIELLENGSLEKISKERELNDLLISDAKRLSDEKKSIEDKELEAQNKIEDDKRKLIEETHNLANTLIDKEIERNRRKSEEEIQSLNDQVEANKRKQNFYSDLAANGDVNAAKSLAASKENERELTKEIRKEKRKQRNEEAALTGLKLLGQNSGKVNAVPKTISESLAVVSGIIAGLPNFFKGTKTTLGDELGYTGKKDSHLIMADENEAIFNPKQTSDLGIGNGRTTQDIVNIVKQKDRVNIGRIINPYSKIEVKQNNNSEITKKLDEVVNSVKNLEMRVDFNLDELNDIMELKVRNGNKIEVKRAFL